MSVPRVLRLRRGQIGLGIIVVICLVALVGPLVAPHPPSLLVGASGLAPSGAFPLGTDYLGRDVLSRVLNGGEALVLLSALATAIAFAVGSAIGMVAGLTRTVVDPLLMRLVDVLLSFPPLLLFLIITASLGSNNAVLVGGVALVELPGVARVVYTPTREVSVRSYVEAAVARGERFGAVLVREVLPNITGPLMANFGITLTYSVLLVAAVNFLGVGQQPPAANWALMISENRPVLQLNPWATIAPAVLIALLTIGVNLFGDALVQALGTSGEAVRRGGRRVARGAGLAGLGRGGRRPAPGDLVGVPAPTTGGEP